MNKSSHFHIYPVIWDYCKDLIDWDPLEMWGRHKGNPVISHPIGQMARYQEHPTWDLGVGQATVPYKINTYLFLEFFIYFLVDFFTAFFG